jgi:hypothetical protein
VVNYLKQEFKKLNIHIDVFLMYHPIDDNVSIPMFSIDNFIKNDNKKIIQVGQQLRKMTSIYLLTLNNNIYQKVWLTGTMNFNHLKKIFKKECRYLNIKNIDINDIEMKYTDTFEEYDKLLSENIVFVDFFDAAANNTVIECILRKTPIILKRLPGTEFYLGKEYPLFFDTIDEVPELLTLENFNNAHVYLQQLTLTSIDTFISQIINILDTYINK